MPAPAPFLTILIPTYNRAALLRSLLEALCPLVAGCRAAERIEVVVADNVSTDATAEVAGAFAARYPFLRHCRKQVHWDSGEGNIFSSVPLLRGEYVWTLGDDDFLLPDCLETLLDVLDAHRPGFVLFDNGIWDADRRPLLDAYVRPSHPVLAFDTILDMAAAMGFITALTTFSSTVWRRAAIARVDWRGYNRASSAYCHVAVYLDAFRAARALLVQRPLIGYRFVPGEVGRSFSRWAREHRVGKLFPWHLGVLRLFDRMVRLGVVQPGYFWSVTETPLDLQAWCGRFVPLHLRVGSELLNQVQYALSTFLPGQFFGEPDGRFLERFYQASPDPRERDLLAELRALNGQGRALAAYNWTPEADGRLVRRRQRLLLERLTRIRTAWAVLGDQPAAAWSGAPAHLGLHGCPERRPLVHCQPCPQPIGRTAHDPS